VILAGGCALVAAWALAGSSRARSPVEDNASVITNADTSVSQHDSMPARPLVVDAGDDRPASETKLSVGDQLKVTVFERLEDFGGPGKTGKPSVGLVEQTMVSGEYLVEESGHVALPLLGAISASDLTIGHLTREIRRAYGAVFHRDAMVSVTITERRPVYLLGPGFKAGAYKFTPGMTVLHLLALAGADDDRRDVYLQSERVR
jgi:protein involved in polysaccharide export with SLBB domain